MYTASGVPGWSEMLPSAEGAHGSVLAFSSEAGIGALVSCWLDGNLTFQTIFLPSSLKLPFLVQWSFWVESVQTENTSLQKQRQKVAFLQEEKCFGFFPSPARKELSVYVILPFFLVMWSNSLAF